MFVCEVGDSADEITGCAVDSASRKAVVSKGQLAVEVPGDAALVVH